MRPTGSAPSGACPLPERGDAGGRPPRLLFDENLSARLVRLLAEVYPGSAHLADVALAGAADGRVWAYAAAHGYVLVTKDEDFHRLSVFRGFPPKVVWVRLGNCSTGEVAALLTHYHATVVEFVAHADAGFLALG